MNTYPPPIDPTKISDAGQHQRLIPPPSAQGVSVLVQDDPCWPDEPSLLVKPSRLIEFFPVADQTLAERVNALSRLVAYIGVGVSVLEKRSTGLQIAIIILGVIFLLWRVNPKSQPANDADVDVEHFDVLPDKCTAPAPGNPFMNFVPGDPVDRGPACTGPGTEQMVTNYFEEGLYADVSDNVFMKPGHQRSFFTQPVTQNPNDRDKLADWLYRDSNLGNPDSERRLPPPYTDERRNRHLIPSDIRYNDITANYPDL